MTDHDVDYDAGLRKMRELCKEAVSQIKHPHAESWGPDGERAKFYQRHILSAWIHAKNAALKAIDDV